MIPIYWGIFVPNCGGKLDRIIQNQHVTFGFRTEYPIYLQGQRVTLLVTGYGNDGQNEAYSVELADWVKTEYVGSSKPHITLSVSSSGKPVDSWKLDFQPIDPFTIIGTFGYFDRSGVHIS